MAIKKTPKLWSASAAALLAGSLAACGEDGETRETADAGATADAGYTPGPAGEGGEGGEGGEAGEAGGEFGIDPDLAGNDPVLYRSAIEVMRAHYIAGLAALDNGDRAVASEMFSHPISEIYVDLEPVIESLGGRTMMDEMNRAAVLHFQDASDDEIRAAVDEVVRLLDVNQAVAPEADPAAAPAVHAAVLASLIERAALQYRFAAEQADASGPWLDGFGLERAAARYAEARLDEVRAADSAAGTALDEALDLLAAAYPAAQPPEAFDPEPAVVIEAARAAVDAAGAMEAAPASTGAAAGGG